MESVDNNTQTENSFSYLTVLENRKNRQYSLAKVKCAGCGSEARKYDKETEIWVCGKKTCEPLNILYGSVFH